MNTPRSAYAGSARTLALCTVAGAMMMDVLDLTIVNVAIPTLQARMGAGDGAIQWMVAGYSTVFAVLLVTGGRLGDLIGHRRMLLFGITGFTAASCGCGMAHDVVMLVLARMAQAVFAAIMLPQVMSLVQVLYAPHERVNALSVFGMLGGTAAVCGPVVGGLIIGADLFGLGWRPIFLINLPVGLVLLVAGWRLLPRDAGRPSAALDAVGVLCATLTLLTLIAPLIEGPILSWPPWCVLSLAACPPLAMVTWRHSTARAASGRPTLLVPALLADRGYASGIAIGATFQATIASFLLMLSITLQKGIGLTAEAAGIAHIPFAIGSALGIGFLARYLLPRLGPAIIAGGAVLMALGLGIFDLVVAHAAHGVHPLLFAPMLLALGLGMGLIGGPLAPVALVRVPLPVAGAASGMLKTAQELGGALGIATVGGLFLHLAGRDAYVRAMLWSSLPLGLTLLLIAALAIRIRHVSLAADGPPMAVQELAGSADGPLSSTHRRQTSP